MDMTQSAREKAVELVNIFLNANADSFTNEDGNKEIVYSLTFSDAKKCAIIAVNEMIKLNGELYLTDNKSQELINYYKSKNAYLFEVKEEIEKL